MDFWGTVGIASAIATALATGVSTAVTIWWRWQDRAEAEFFGYLLHAGGWGAHGPVDVGTNLQLNLSNIGDGVAHKVQVNVSEFVHDPSITEIGPENPKKIATPIPVMRTGDSVGLLLTVDSIGNWNKASFTVSWWPPPTRKKRSWFRSREMRQQFAFTDFSSMHTTQG